MNKSNNNDNNSTKNPNANNINKRVKKSDNTKVPALIIGGALLGNIIVPGVGGAILGGVIGGFLGNNSQNNRKGK